MTDIALPAGVWDVILAAFVVVLFARRFLPPDDYLPGLYFLGVLATVRDGSELEKFAAITIWFGVGVISGSLARGVAGALSGTDQH